MNKTPMYISTVADENHYILLLNLIGSIHRHNFDDLEEISVFNLGLSDEHINELNLFQKVKVYQIEKTNPYIFCPMPAHNFNRAWPKGLYSWKFVVIKQSLDMHPHVLYVDAGTTIRKNLTGLFKHIIQNKYWLIDCGQELKMTTCKHLIDKFELNKEENKWILGDGEMQIDGGMSGYSRDMYDTAIMPMYELCKDIRHFLDDGTCVGGWGNARHDQTLFSILVKKLKLKIYNHDRTPCESFLEYDGKKEPIHITHLIDNVKEDTLIFRSRWSLLNPTEENNKTLNDNIRSIVLKGDYKFV